MSCHSRGEGFVVFSLLSSYLYLKAVKKKKKEQWIFICWMEDTVLGWYGRKRECSWLFWSSSLWCFGSWFRTPRFSKNPEQDSVSENWTPSSIWYILVFIPKSIGVGIQKTCTHIPPLLLLTVGLCPSD